jgi:hypothetical protein
VRVLFSHGNVQPLTGGRHAAAATDPRHWACWRREPLAYAAGLLPSGPGLSAPRCYGVVDDVVYVADVTGQAESPAVAARRLGAWQAATAVPDVPWLAGHQLAQRIAVSSLLPSNLHEFKFKSSNSNSPAPLDEQSRAPAPRIGRSLRCEVGYCTIIVKMFASSGDMIGAVLAGWRHETNRLPPQRPRAA